MSTNEKVIELSIEETNALRLKLGLKPLNIASSSNGSKIESKCTSREREEEGGGGTLKSSQSSNSGDVIELSIEETNDLRQKLGLKPLDLENDSNDDNKKKKVIHAPARNMAKEKEIEERILDAKMRREVDKGIQRFQKNQEEKKSNEKEDLQSWIERMRKSKDEDNKKKVKKVKKKSSNKKEVKDKNASSSLTDEQSSSPLAVPEKAQEGMVLTLKDEEILEHDDKETNTSNKLKINEKKEVLEHVSWRDDQKAKEYKKGKLEVGGGGGVGSGGWADVDIEEEGEELTKKNQKQSNNNDVKLQIASDYMTLEEEMQDVSSSTYKKSQIKAQKKLLKQFKKRDKKTKLSKKKNLKRFRDSNQEKENNDDNDNEKDKKIQKKIVDDDENNDDQEDEMKRRKEKYDKTMKAATLRSQNAFFAKDNGINNKTTQDNEVGGQKYLLPEKEADSMADMIKAKRLAKLKKLQNKTKKAAADVVVDAIKTEQAEQQRLLASNGGTKEDEGAITFELDPTKEFTRAMRAATIDATSINDDNNKASASEASTSNKKDYEPIIQDSSKTVQMEDDNNNEEEMNIHQLAAQMETENENDVSMEQNEDEEEELEFGTNKSVGRGLSSVLSLLQSTGDISTTKNPHASKEKLRGRAKDERHYEDYSNLDLSKTVKINSNQEKDKQFAQRQIKLDYRDEHGRLLTRKEAFRQMCYQFHGYGSFNKTKEKRLKAMQREQAIESSGSNIVNGGGAPGNGNDSNSSTLGVLKKMQEVTKKAFVVHKT